ncbi:hypothetical protein [Rhizobium mulingense]|uniref:hypothetical protein n=1 Tax=Rhizobium mulingense TaxID=3031128 RepID=UPI002B47F753|nr:hypothetical protein [Rhizobium sp. MJ21]MEB3047698.1 hypothetical protein [Rhizobium sp. MJ21]
MTRSRDMRRIREREAQDHAAVYAGASEHTYASLLKSNFSSGSYWFEASSRYASVSSPERITGEGDGRR